MPLQDYLLPLENIRFYSRTSVSYGGKRYNVLVTDKRLLLFAQRGYLLRSDDIVSERLERLQGLEYSEKGLLFKTAKILIQGSSKMEIKGPPSELKPLFQNMQAILERRE
jgi:hypothetical protein